MREITSPLGGFLSPFGQRREVSLLALYAANGLNPSLVIDAKTPRYFLDGVQSDLTSVTDHSRASSATYRDSNGVLQTAASGVLRDQAYAYADGVLTGPYVLTEPDGVNLITYSEVFNQGGGWSTVNIGSTLVNQTGPDGIVSATRLVASSAGGSTAAYVGNPLTVNTATLYTFSVFCKADTLSYAMLYLVGFDASPGGYYFDLSAGTIGTTQGDQTGITAQIENCGNGWYRCALTFTSDASDTTGEARVYLSDGDGDFSVPLDGISSILTYGAQFEQGSVPTSYIPTSGSQGARAEDVLTIPDAPWPSGAAGSRAIGISMKGLMTGDSKTLVDWTLDANSGIQIGSGASDFTFTQEASGVVDSVTGGGYTSGINVPFSIASYHKDNGINGAVDGVALTEDTTPTILPDLSTTPITIRAAGGPLYLEEMRIWVEGEVDKITDTLIEEASAP